VILFQPRAPVLTHHIPISHQHNIILTFYYVITIAVILGQSCYNGTRFQGETKPYMYHQASIIEHQVEFRGMVTGVNYKHQSDCQSDHKPSNIYHITTNMKSVSSIHVYLSIKHLMYKLAMKENRWTKLKPTTLFFLFISTHDH
jgi:hypothetical protein